jgi:hypothetical protein
MNYYIITLRDNLDNILSSESISPSVYYSRRGFGYHSIGATRMSMSDYELTLYTEPIETDEDVVYIELSGKDEQMKGLRQNGIGGAYLTDKTIWLYPWNCRVLFKTIQDAKDSFFICRSSLSNKMWNCYRFGLIEKTTTCNESEIFAADFLVIDVTSRIVKDQIRNKAKGFLFSYYLGLMKSVSPELAKMIQAERKMYGLATVLAGMQKPSTDMVKMLNSYRTVYNANDPNRQKLKRLWQDYVLNSFSSEKDKEVFESFLSRYGVQYSAMDAFAREQGVALCPRIDTSLASGRDWVQFKTMLDKYTQTLIQQYIERNELSVSADVRNDDGYIHISKETDDVYEQLINYILSNHDFLSTDNIRSKKLEAATEATKFVMNYYEFTGRKWEGSKEQSYLNNLRQNIAQSTPFDPNDIESKSLRALAIYILKGDNIDDMINYIQITGVEDYSMVFGLWGINVGYSDMPKTFISRADLPSDKMLRCYINMYETLSGERTDIQLDPNSYEHILKTAEVKARQDVKKESCTPATSDAVALLTESSLKLTQVQMQELLGIVNRDKGRLDENSFKQIGKIKGIGKKKLENIRLLLMSMIHNQSLFSHQETEEKEDKMAWTVVEDILPADEKVRTQVKRDFMWFVDKNYHLMGKAELIAKLCDYLSRNKNATGNRSWLRGLYKDVEISAIESKLRETYL